MVAGTFRLLLQTNNNLVKRGFFRATLMEDEYYSFNANLSCFKKKPG